MPDKEVETIQDLFYYQYAKIIARSAFSMSDGRKAKGQHYGFIKNTFHELKNGKKRWSDILREDWQFVESDKRCIYCGGKNAIHREHIVPRSLKIKSECEVCEVIQGIHNQIWACEQCNSSKGVKGLYRFYESKYTGEKNFMI